MKMELYLLRHADADTMAETDDARPLSEKGEGQGKKVARFFEARRIAPARVLSSPVLRALQTAEIVVAHLGLELTVVPWLACGMRPAEALKYLQEYAGEPAVMIVGHEPDFSGLAAWLLGLPSGEHVEIRKASLTRLTVAAWERGGARLDFSLPCRLM